MKKFSLSEFPEPSRLVGRLTRSWVSRAGVAGAGAEVCPVLWSLLREQLMGLLTLGKAKTLRKQEAAKALQRILLIFLSVSGG